MNEDPEFLCAFAIDVAFCRGGRRRRQSFCCGAGQFRHSKAERRNRIPCLCRWTANAKAAVLIVHDYFDVSDATKQSVERLGALRYRSVGVDLYEGKSATSHEEAMKLMQSLDRKATDKILQAGTRLSEANR
jgi:hypothetical protein